MEQIFDSVLCMDYTKQINWILPITVIAIANVVEVWILMSLIHYGLKTKKWKTRKQNCGGKVSSRNQYTALVACAAFCLIFSTLSLINISVGFDLDENSMCDLLADAAVVFYSFIQAAVFIFLWLRQRSFYTNQMLNVTYSKPARVFSVISIIMFLFAGTILTVLFVYPNDHFSSLNGCVRKPNAVILSAWIFVVLVLIFGQTTLLGLFFYALTKTGNQEIPIFARLLDNFCCSCKRSISETTQTPKNSNQSSAEPSTNPVSNCTIFSVSRTIALREAQHFSFLKNSKSAQNIQKVMRKTLWLAIISALLDFFTQIFQYYISYPNSDHMRFAVIATNSNALLSLLLLVFSYTVHSKMLSSLCISVTQDHLNCN